MGSSQTSYVFHGLLSQDVAYCPTGFRELTDGSFARAKVLVPECLDHVSTTNIRKYFQHCYQYMDAYRYVTAAAM